MTGTKPFRLLVTGSRAARHHKDQRRNRMTTIDIDAIRTDLDTRQQYIDLGKQPSVAAYLAGTIADRAPALLAKVDELTAELADVRAKFQDALWTASQHAEKARELTAALAEKDAQLTAANRRNDGLQADLNSATKANTAWANETAAKDAVIEAAKAWRGMRSESANVRPKPEAAALIAAVDALTKAATV